MKHLVLLKEGDYRPNIFSSLVEVVNNTSLKEEERDQVSFFTRTDFSLRLYANMTVTKDQGALALAHYSVNPYEAEQDPNKFRAVDVELMREALEEHKFVLFAVISDTFIVADYGLVNHGIYIVRDDEGNLINYETKERLVSDGSVINAVTFFGMVKAGDLPVYYLITDSNVVHIGDGFDFDDTDHDVLYRKITDHDGTIKENLFVPKFSDGTTLVGKYDLFTVSDKVTISFFEDGVIAYSDLTRLLPELQIDIQSNVPVECEQNKVVVNMSSTDVGYVKIFFKLGHFFEEVQQKEKPIFEFILHKE